MRLDKFLTVTGTCSRSVAKKQIRAGAVTVNGAVPVGADVAVNEERDEIFYCGKKIVYRKYTYIVLNKPEGVVSATEDGRDKTVLDLLPEGVRTRGMFPCGRLDKYTLGLILLTDNGELAHKLLAPKTHVKKVYKFKSASPLSAEDVKRFESGLTLDGGYETKPAEMELEEDCQSGYITLTEGKYHQIKRMLEALDNKITYLERVRFGELTLEGIPSRGEWRYLTEDEITKLENSTH